MKTGITIYGAHLLVQEENRTVANIIRAAAHLGFDGIDLGYYWGENKTAEFEDARKIADGEGIAIANYIVGNNFGNAAAEERLDAEIEKVKIAIEEAAQFNCSALRVFAGGYDLNWDEYSPQIADAFAACLETAQKNNVVMALEDHGALCKNSAEQLFYINRINSPYLRATADIGNYWHPGGERPVDGVKNIAGFVAMVHVKDYVIINNTPVACPSGDGIIDLKTSFRLLKDSGFDGYLSLEYECQTGIPKHGITTSLSNIRNLVAAC